MIDIEVTQLQTDGRTLWIHSAKGATVLRIKLIRPLDFTQCRESPVSHMDLTCAHSATLCLSAEDYAKAKDFISAYEGVRDAKTRP